MLRHKYFVHILQFLMEPNFWGSWFHQLNPTSGDSGAVEGTIHLGMFSPMLLKKRNKIGEMFPFDACFHIFQWKWVVQPGRLTALIGVTTPVTICVTCKICGSLGPWVRCSLKKGFPYEIISSPTGTLLLLPKNM